METSEQPPKKSSKQKGQGMLEYALILSFVAAMFIVVFPEGFGDSITGTFDNATELLGSATEESNFEGGSGGGGSSGGSSGGTLLGSLFGGGDSNSGDSGNNSSSIVENTIDDIASKNYVTINRDNYTPLDWVTLNNDIKLTFDTITKTPDPDKAIASEYNLFYQLAAMTDGKGEFIYKDRTTGELSFYNNGNSDLKGWNDLVAQIKTQTTGISTSNYVSKTNPNEKLWITRNDDSNKITMHYSTDGGTTEKTFSLSADNEGIVHFESTGTTAEVNALTAYGKLAQEAKIYYPKGVWQFNK